MSRQSSSDVSGGAVKKVQNRQSMEYPGMQGGSHSGTPGRSNRKQHLETGYDQHTFPRGQQRQITKRDMSDGLGGGSEVLEEQDHTNLPEPVKEGQALRLMGCQMIAYQ